MRRPLIRRGDRRATGRGRAPYRLALGLALAATLPLATPASAIAAPRTATLSQLTKPARMTAAERQDFDLVNADRAVARVGPLGSSAVLQAIANKRVREMAARHAGYAGHDVTVELKAAHVCFTASREIEDELTGGGGGDYPYIEQDPRYTLFADAILHSGGGTYEVEDYLTPCGQHPAPPLALPKATLRADGLAISVGQPAAGASLQALDSPIITLTNPTACNAAASLYLVVSYSGSGAARFSERTLPTGATLDQPVHNGRNALLLAAGPLEGPYSFTLEVTARIRLPDHDAVTVTLPDTGYGAKDLQISPSC